MLRDISDISVRVEQEPRTDEEQSGNVRLEKFCLINMNRNRDIIVGQERGEPTGAEKRII